MVEPTLPLSHLRAKLAQPRGHRLVESLIEAENPAESVAALSVVDVFQLVHEVGFADALQLVGLATPQQIRGCIDLDSWERDRFDIDRIKPWLTAIIDAGYEKVAEVWSELDAEFTALFVARLVRIYDLSLADEPVDDDKYAIFVTPDRFFAVQLRVEDEDATRLVHRLISDLYRADPSGRLARHTLMAARSEPEASLEEMSYRWRSGRLADLGYIAFHEALIVFRPIDPTSVTVDENTTDQFAPTFDDEAAYVHSLPVPVAEQVAGLSFLSRALDRIDDPDELARLEMASMVLINKVLAAAHVSPGDTQAMSVAAEHTLSTLSIGLESVSKGDLEQAERALRRISFTRLHRLGYTLTLRLSFMAKALYPRARTAGAPTEEVLDALLARRPFFPRVLDDPPGADVRAIASLADIRHLAEILTALALRIAIVDSLDVNLIAIADTPTPRPMLDDHVRTALVWALLEQPVQTTPLTAADLVTFRARVMPDGAIQPGRRIAASRLLIAHLDGRGVIEGRSFLPDLVTGWFDDLEDALGPLPTQPDARFVDRVLLAHRQQ